MNEFNRAPRLRAEFVHEGYIDMQGRVPAPLQLVRRLRLQCERSSEAQRETDLKLSTVCSDCHLRTSQ